MDHDEYSNVCSCVKALPSSSNPPKCWAISVCGRPIIGEGGPDRNMRSLPGFRGRITDERAHGGGRGLDRPAGLRQHGVIMETKFSTVSIEKPEAVNFILGQTHFIKSVEDIHEALVTAVPGIKFGLAFCEASGKCLVRWSGTDPAMIELARKNALAIGAGHSFILFLAEGFYPVNVLNAIKLVPEVCRIFCATANPTEVLVAQTGLGRGITGVIDGSSPKGVEGAADIAWRKSVLRLIGYKS